MKRHEFDIFSSNSLENIDEWVAELFDKDDGSGMYWHPIWRKWIIYDYDVYKEALSDDERFILLKGPNIGDPTPSEGRWRAGYSMMLSHGEAQAKSRRRVIRWMSENYEKYVSTFKKHIKDDIDNIQSGVPIKNTDFITNAVLKTQFDMCGFPLEALGYTKEDRERFHKLYVEWMDINSPFVTFDPENDYTINSESKSEFVAIMQTLCIESFIHYKTHNDPGSSFNMMHDVLNERTEYNDNPMITMMAFYFGLMLTIVPTFLMSVFTHFIKDICMHPEEISKVKENVELADNFIKESLRLAPVYGGERETTYTFDFHGRTLHPRNMVIMSHYAANRDPKKFKDPFKFDMYRDTSENKMVSFSFGIHKCLGEHVAKQILSDLLFTILDKFENYELVNKGTLKTSMIGSVPIYHDITFKFS